MATTLPPPLPRSRAPQATRERPVPPPPSVSPGLAVAPRVVPTEAINLAARIEAVADAELAELPPVRVRFAPPSRMPAGTLPPPVPAKARAASPRTTLPPPVPTRKPATPTSPISSSTRSAASGSIQTPSSIGHHDETVRTPQVDIGEPSVLFTTDVPKRAAVGTFPPPLRTTRAKSPELFMAPPSAATMSSAGLLIASLERDAHASSPFATQPPSNAPVAAPFETLTRDEKPAPMKWFEGSSAAKTSPSRTKAVDETWMAPLPAGKAEYLALAKRLAVPGLVCIAIGVGLGFYVSTGTGKAPHARPQAAPARALPTAVQAQPPAAEETVLHPVPRSAESANAATASAGGEQPEPPTKAEQAALIESTAQGAAMTHDAPAEALAGLATREVKTAHGTITLADVRIDSDPSGASVTLVDGGTQLPLGSTPLSTSVDVAREYDVIVEVAGRAPQMVHLDPKSTSRLDIALGREVSPKVDSKPEAKVDAKPDVKVDAKPEPTPETKPSAKVETHKVRKAVHADDLESPAPAAAAASTSGTGTLMVSTKPPCEIIVDGTPTGLTTPQRSIPLASGRHKITFVNTEAGIKKTVSVTIKADQPTKLIQNLMK